MTSPTPAELNAATEAFHAALDREGQRLDRNLGHGREGEWVDDVPVVVVEALLRAGWTPPAAYCERDDCGHARSLHREPMDEVNPDIIGAVRRGPQGHGTVRIDNAGAQDWLMVGAVGGTTARYTDEAVRDWPVVGAVPGTPAAWMAGEPLPPDATP